MKAKRIVYSVISAMICVFMLLVFSACGEDKYVPEGMKVLSNDIVKYNLYIPNDWTGDISTGVVSAYYSPAASTDDHSNISMTEFELEEEDTTISEYWESYRAQLEDTFGNISFITDGETLLVDSKSAQKYVYTATVTGNEYEFMQVLIKNNGKMYIFTYTSTPDYYDAHTEDVTDMLTYLSFNS